MKKIINALRAPASASSTELAAALDKARADLVAAETAVTAAEAEYDAALLVETSAALRKLHDGITDAAIDRDRASAVIGKLERQYEAAVVAEAADARQQQYDRAKAASEAAEKRLRAEYPKAALAIRGLLAELAAAALAVREANADLPESAAPLSDPERSRSEPNLYHEVLSEDIAELWTTIDGTTPIADELQRAVRAHEKHRRGMMTDRSDSQERPLAYGSVQTEHGHLEVVRKRFRRTKFLPDVSGRHVAALASEIVLPPLEAGASPYWSPADDSHCAARQAAEQLKPKPPRSEREPQFAYHLVSQ